jgi:hypothetical protein
MGASGSPGKAILCMEVILERIMELLPFLYIYVDDILTAIPANLVEETLEIFNAINFKIQFTVETEKDGAIPFLDLKLFHNMNWTISTEFYQKPSSSGRILNFQSKHPLSLKINTTVGLIKRVYTFSTFKNEKENYDTINQILKEIITLRS